MKRGARALSWPLSLISFRSFRSLAHPTTRRHERYICKTRWVRSNQRFFPEKLVVDPRAVAHQDLVVNHAASRVAGFLLRAYVMPPGGHVERVVAQAVSQ